MYILLFLLAVSSVSVIAKPSGEQDIRKWLSKKPIIDKIIIEGNTFFTDSKIKNTLYSRTSNIFRAINKDRRRRVQEKETLLRDTANVKFLYLSAGFLGIKVSEYFKPTIPDSHAVVHLVVDEGRQFYYGTFENTGNNRFAKWYKFIEITKRFERQQPVDPFKLRQALYDIKSLHANNGYPYAYAEYSIDTSSEDNFTHITFEVHSDSLVHFGDLNINGADNFDTSLIQREMTFTKDDLYRRRDIIESQKRLLNTGYFLTLQLNPVGGDSLTAYQRSHPELTLTVKEKKAQYVSIKTGFAQDSVKDLKWTSSASWGKRNFLKSRQLELTTSASFEIFTGWYLLEHSYRLRVTEPWFLGTRMPLTLTALYEPGVRSTIQPYRKESWSLSVSTQQIIKEKLKILTGFQYESVKIYGLSKQDEEQIRDSAGISIRRRFFVNITRDSRKNIFIPRHGSVTNLRLEYIGGFLGGDASFYLLEASWSRYQRFWPGWIAATRFKGGFLQPIGESKTIPTDDRYFIGGANTVRGFTEKELGPKSENNIPIGADMIVLMNQEMRYPIFGKFWGSIFLDIGNGYINRKDIKFDNLAVSYGLGVQFISPAGPIRLDYARRVRVKGIESGYKFHFTILYAF